MCRDTSNHSRGTVLGPAVMLLLAFQTIVLGGECRIFFNHSRGGVPGRPVEYVTTTTTMAVDVDPCLCRPPEN